MEEYDPRVTPWQITERGFPHAGGPEDKLLFLLRYAILAPSSHNTQPWQFSVYNEEIGVYADTSRWLKVADADQRELHISVGCALENLLIAAEHFGYRHQVDYFPSPLNPDLVATVQLAPHGEPSPFREPALFDAIPVRHTNHKSYEQEPIPEEEQQRLQACCVEEGITLFMTGDQEIKWKADHLLIRADAMQFADPAFREELGYWIGQGVFGAPWLLAKLSQLAVRYLNVGENVATRDSEVLMSAPVLAVLASRENDRRSQVKIGQVFERIFLTASALGISVQPMSQVVEIPETKSALAKLLPMSDLFPQQPFRLGYAEPERHHTPRRPLDEFLV